MGDHPRMRGVYGDDREVRDVAYGSSPHARGLPQRVQGGVHEDRIIPACAGFTRGPRRADPPEADHPRMRGVYRVFVGYRFGNRGSSPHARGLLEEIVRGEADGRIIPACAGFTTAATAPPPRRRDHPRMRGVYPSPVDTATISPGSSPHARGLHPQGGRGPGRRGIIPACAGFTAGVSGSGRGRPDHPRMRGVYPGR